MLPRIYDLSIVASMSEDPTLKELHRLPEGKLEEVVYYANGKDKYYIIRVPFS